MTDELDSWGELAALRQAVYRFFGGSLLLPDEARLEGMIAAAAALDAARVTDVMFPGPWEALLTALDDAPPVDRLESLYLGLFMTGTDGALCPPTESQHMAAGGLATVIVRVERDLGELGLSSAPGLLYAPDHVATELEAMASLCHREAHAWEEGDTAAAVRIARSEWSFLDRHLFRWLPRFARRLGATTPPGLYPAIADAAAAFVQHDHEFVSALAALRIPAKSR